LDIGEFLIFKVENTEFIQKINRLRKMDIVDRWAVK
jgi:hypothetical protein